jgi:hypothetical protein
MMTHHKDMLADRSLKHLRSMMGERDWSGPSAIANAEDLIRECAAINASPAIFRIDEDPTGADSGDDVPLLVVFADGSGFFVATDEKDFTIWPIEAAPTGAPYNSIDLIPRIDPVGVADYLPERLGKVVAREDLDERITNHLRRCAEEMFDPPVEILHLSSRSSRAFEWDASIDREAVELILLQFAALHVPAGHACALELRSESKNGRTPAQKRHDDVLISCMRKHAHGELDANASASISGEAYACLSDVEYFPEFTPVNTLIAWFSRKVMGELGHPIGWGVEYNDGHRLRSSGYSASNSFDVVSMDRTGHAQIESFRDVHVWMTDRGLMQEYVQQVKALGIRDALSSPVEILTHASEAVA